MLTFRRLSGPSGQPRNFALLGIVALLIWPPGERAGMAAAASGAFPGDDRAITHVLNRLGFGPRAGDLERVRALGIERYIEQQLHPERIPDESMTTRLAPFETLTLSTRELSERYFLPALMARRARRQASTPDPSQPGPGQEQMAPEGNPSLPDRPRDGQRPSRRPGGTDLESRPQTGAPGDAARRLSRRPEQQVLVELTEQKLLRALYSERQLQEVMVDFWFNHFNVFAGKGATRLYLTEYERDAIRPHVFGKFRNLLGAVAQSPAMLFYLDNWLSADPEAGDRARARRRLAFPGAGQNRRRAGGSGTGPIPPGGQPSAQPLRRARGLNENYARELMELHTLGVDGGYTQKDIIEVARAFTGWTIEAPRAGGGFRFNPHMHDPGEKVVLGHRIESDGGQDDGERVLDILVQHPSTARFIATKLARRFISDAPPATVIDRAAARFRETDGDIREVVRTIVTSREFFAPDAYRAKVKTPFEFVTSAVRITGAPVTDARSLGLTLRELGMPLYFSQPPTGYGDEATAWINAGALVGRINFALSLVSNRLNGVAADPTALAVAGDLDQARAHLVKTILADEASTATRTTLEKGKDLQQLAALTIGAPEFQKK